jgi:hypothetical protein
MMLHLPIIVNLGSIKFRKEKHHEFRVFDCED